MCGIAGFCHLDAGRQAGVSLVRTMNEAMRHRGPDASDTFTDGPVGLGHGRLKILDLSDAANQPMRGASGSVIVYNGECYNYLELKRELEGLGHVFRTTSDTEVVLAMYEQYGKTFAGRLRGMFALAVWDPRRRELVLVRDRMGIKPLYYSLADETVSFASELKGMLALPWVSRDIDLDALGRYFRLYSIPDPLSVIKDVRRLAPGHMLTVRDGKVREEQWWTLADVETVDTDMETAAAGLLEGIEDAVASHLVSDVPVGIALSGGIDSSGLAALAARNAGEPLHTFSVAVPGSEHDEGAMAAEYAEVLGTIHHEIQFSDVTPGLLERFVRFADEPFAISSGLGLFRVAEEASRCGVKVLLTGDGGDELFGGYLWRHGAPVPESNRAEAYARSMWHNGDMTLGEILLPGAKEALGDGGLAHLAMLYRRPALGDPLKRRLYTDSCSTLVSEMLAKSDRMTMAHGVEGRVPLLDHHLVEKAFSLPSAVKLVDGQGKAVLRKALATVLPRSILDRRKRGFNVPVANTFRGETREYVLDVLSDAARAERGLYRPEVVRERFLDPLARGHEFSLEESHRLFAILALEMWMSHVAVFSWHEL
ncbi:asparagine synthase (glutamine-hydrolyzing) [Pseudodesulfovibrio portus]|uniref:asparagine synthase (glutamine-hydrolyzing) n=1 Tax=Pseudodesulfovibrio portus TaxID=231439 RepID=A0ABN6RXD4_9BACT|nr:asparagine synthase (glutamine-hydrolyzing) [Pseudodesulfovibrio portus]BDQ34697.1 asparagine synthetase B [Pseudodesulfovibrio portus]